jgi:hypothetical protein
MTRLTPSAARPLALAAALALLGAGCGSRTPTVGGSNSPKAQENRRLAESYAAAAAVGAATAEVRAHPEMAKKSSWEKGVAWVRAHVNPGVAVAPVAIPTPATPAAIAPPPPAAPVAVRVEVAVKPLPPPGGSVLIRERVASEIPLQTEAEAEEATIAAAADRLTEAFAKLDPPLDYRPSPAAVKSDFLRRDSRQVRPPTEAEKTALARVGYAADRVYVEYTLEASAEQVREIRGRERVSATLRLFGLLGAAAAVGFVFLRVDAWSQGYLTSWLAFVAAALAGGAVAAYALA